MVTMTMELSFMAGLTTTWQTIPAMVVDVEHQVFHVGNATPEKLVMSGEQY